MTVQEKCEFCDGAKPLVIGKTNDQGIALIYPNILNAYGYDVHGYGNNGLSVRIKYCPMCGKNLSILVRSNMIHGDSTPSLLDMTKGEI